MADHVFVEEPVEPNIKFVMENESDIGAKKLHDLMDWVSSRNHPLIKSIS